MSASSSRLSSVVLNLDDYRKHLADTGSDGSTIPLAALKCLDVLQSRLDRVTIRTGYNADGTCTCCSASSAGSSDDRLAGELLRTHISSSKFNELVIHYDCPDGDEAVSPIPAFLNCNLRGLFADKVIQTSGSKGSSDPSLFYMPPTASSGHGGETDSAPTKYTMGRTVDDDTSKKHIERMILEAISAGKQKTSSCFEFISPSALTLDLSIPPEELGSQKWSFIFNKLATFEATERGKILTELQ